MQLIDQMSKKELKELIGKCWMTHDGMWFAHTLFDQGIEVTNRLNKAAIKSMVPVEIKRFKKVLKFTDDPVKSYDMFRNFFLNVTELLIPEFMNVEITFPGEGIISWRFNEKGCFAFNGVRMLNIVDQYECGPLYRIRCWLDELGLDYKMDPDITVCMMNKSGQCCGRFSINSFSVDR